MLTPSLPASWYCDPSVYDRERRAVFAREWLFAGMRERLRVKGDYLSTTVAGWSIVVVQLDDSGTLGAFHNVCRHRGGPLVDAVDGHCAGAFVCRYHGWTYALDGALRRARDFGAEVDPAGMGLWTVRVDTWRGLVFVNLAPRGPSLLEALGSFADACAEFPMEEFRAYRRVHSTVEANWKAYADNYLEGYHLPLVHPELARQVDAQRYEVEVHDGWCEHRAPARDGAATAGRWLWRYPNLALNLYPAGMNVETFAPDGAARTTVEYTYCFADGAPEHEREESLKLSLDLLEEDRVIVEAVQRNLAAGVYTAGPLSPKHEQALVAFQRRIRSALEVVE